MPEITTLDPIQRTFVAAARTATLATIAADGRPRLVPICFVLGAPDRDRPDRIYSPIDDKPKATADALGLARVRDLLADARASLLIDHWSEEWDRLGWIRLDATGAVLEPGRDGADEMERRTAVAALRANYPQYAGHRLEVRPVIRFTVERVVAWGALAPTERDAATDRGTAPPRAGGGSGSSSSPGGSRRR